jgi:hypothetical protein
MEREPDFFKILTEDHSSKAVGNPLVEHQLADYPMKGLLHLVEENPLVAHQLEDYPKMELLHLVGENPWVAHQLKDYLKMEPHH